MYISRGHRRRGIATAIYRLLEEEAIKRGLEELELHSSKFAVAFYKGLGYRTTRESRWSVGEYEVLNYVMMKKTGWPNGADTKEGGLS